MAKQTFTTGQVLSAAQMTSLQQTAMGGGSATAKTASYVLVAADAGTVIQMNSASATTITVNTALFASGDSVQIQNIGAGVCTVTAGTATVNTAGSLALSQYEGGQLYFNTTSAALFFDIVQGAGMTNPMTTTGDSIYSSSGSTPARLGIGSTGQVLTVAAGIPSWATPASGGGMTSIASGSLSGSSLSLTSISGSYKNLQLIIRQFRGSDDGAELTAGINTDATSVYGKSASITELNVNATSTAWTQFSRRQDNGAVRSLLKYDFIDYANTTTWKMVDAFAVTVDSVDTTQFNIQRSGFVVKLNAAITSIQLSPDTGSFAGGTYILYGVN